MLSAPDFEQKQLAVALLSHGDKLSFRNDNIIITDTERKIIFQATCYRLHMLLVIGHMSVTSGLIQRAEKFRFTIVLMTTTLRVYCVLCSSTEGNTLLRKKQYSAQGARIAQHLVSNKINQQINVIKNIRAKNDMQKNALKLLSDYQQKLLNTSPSSQELLGIEGVAAKVYFGALFGEFGWKRRAPRAKIDHINVLMDIGYTVLFNFIESLLRLYGFDLYQGVYHTQFYQRKSLVCDLEEPFRPIIDARIYKAKRLSQIHADDFSIIQDKYVLCGNNAVPYIKILIESVLEYKRDIFVYIQQYYRSFIREKPIGSYPIFDINLRRA